MQHRLAGRSRPARIVLATAAAVALTAVVTAPAAAADPGRGSGAAPGRGPDRPVPTGPAPAATTTAASAYGNLQEGFESGTLDGYARAGDTSTIGALGPIQPPEGGSMLSLTTGPGAVPVGQGQYDSGSSVGREFAVPPGADVTIRYSWNMVSSEFGPDQYPEEGFTDSFAVQLLKTSGDPVVVQDFAITSDTGFTPVDVPLPEGDDTVGQTGWQTQVLDLTAAQVAGVRGIEFDIWDIGDANLTSALLVDDLAVTWSYTCHGDLIGLPAALDYLDSIGFGTLSAADQDGTLAHFCAALGWADGSNYELVAEAEPPLAGTVVAGGGAPIGRYAQPGTTRPDGTTSACPYYSQRAVYRAVRDVIKLPDIGPLRAAWRAFQQNVLGTPPTQLKPLFRLAKGDLVLSLRVSVEACTQNYAFTDVSPAPGQEPRWIPVVEAPGTALGYSTPTSAVNKEHDFTDKPANKKLESYARVTFPYSVDVGVLKLPTNITGLSTRTLGVKLTLYADGTWDYGLEGSN